MAATPLSFSTSSIDRATQVYVEQIVRQFRFLKAACGLDEAMLRAIAIEDGRGWLVPIGELHARDERLIRDLTRWRNRHVDAYPSQFVADVDGTARWLRHNVLNVEDRLLFLVLDEFGDRIGHLGFANCANEMRDMEVDNVLRGVDGASPGLMAAAMSTMLAWAVEQFAPASISLRVFADNERAIRFYERLGFERRETIPLRRCLEGDSVRYRPIDGPGDRAFLRMIRARIDPKPIPETILTAGPSIGAYEAVFVHDAVLRGWNESWNGYLSRFEREFAEYVGVRHALATSSCTGALHLALLALGIGPGDEVIVPEITWVATANAVRYTGATPVFADVREDSWCLDAESVASLVTTRTKAIIPVHLYGHPADMDAMRLVAARHGLAVVEDAAPSIGAEWRGRRTGGLGDVGCFSFQGAKLLVTGEGGMLVTDDDALYERARKLWDQGRKPGTFWIEENGWKYKMSNVQAALGLGQLRRVDALVEAKRRIFSWYEEDLQGLDRIALHREVSGARSIYWMTSIRLLDGDRDALRARLRENGVDTRPVFPPISRYPIWDAETPPRPIAQRIGDGGINLPSGVRLTRDEIAHVSRSVHEALRA